MGCHFLLQCMKVKSESEVTQSCPTPSDPMDCSLPGSSVHGIFQARVLEWGAIAFSDMPLRWSKSRPLTTASAGEEAELSFVTVLVGMQTGTAQLEDAGGFFQNEAFSNHTIQQLCLPLHLCKGDENFCPHKILHPSVHSSFVRVKIWREPRHPSVGEWRNKPWCIQAVEYYSVIKRNELSSPEKT